MIVLLLLNTTGVVTCVRTWVGNPEVTVEKGQLVTIGSPIHLFMLVFMPVVISEPVIACHLCAICHARGQAAQRCATDSIT